MALKNLHAGTHRAPLIAAILGVLVCFWQSIVPAATLSHIETLESESSTVGGSDGNLVRSLDGVSGAESSPDGKYLYVTAFGNDALNVFSRDPQTGRLTLVQVIKQGVDGMDGLHSAKAVAVSPDSRYVYTMGLGDDGRGFIVDATILGFERDEATGRLTQIERVSSSELSSELDSTFAKLAFSPDGFFLYVSAFNSPNITVFQKFENGQLGFKEASSNWSDPNTRAEISYPFDIVVSPDGQNVYTVAEGSMTTSPAGDSLPRGSLVAFTRNPVTGTLTTLGIYKNHVSGFTELAEPKSVVISPDGNQVYVAASDSHGIAIFDRAADGRLTFRESFKYAEPQTMSDNALQYVDSLTMSPNGRFLYAGSSITALFPVLMRDTATGDLIPIGVEGQGINALDAGSPVTLTMSPDGRFLYAGVINAMDGVISFDASADVSIVVKSSPQTVLPGGTLTYTATVSNEGAADADAVQATLMLPDEVQYVSASVALSGVNCTRADKRVTCDLGEVIAGATATITLVATVPTTPAAVTLEAAVSAAQVDPDTANNTDSEMTTVSETVPLPDKTENNSGSSGSNPSSDNADSSDSSANTDNGDAGGGGGGALGPFLVALAAGLRRRRR